MSNKKFKLDNFFMRDFGKRLKKAREQLKIDVNEISNIIGIEANSYYKYEDGSRFPRPEILSAILNKFDINLNYLVTGTGPMFIITGSNQKSISERLQDIFPGIPQEAVPLVQSLEVPIMRHALMMEYLVCTEKYKSFIRDHFKQKKEKEENSTSNFSHKGTQRGTKKDR
ncbi:MAG: helix-turn-helix transcriptional regulator [Candidatus Aminicenantes bacterium]|nr:MAG: helix-turn-helix transcriptional regulator [Candidatus Aminicenantes bacterium]